MLQTSCVRGVRVDDDQILSAMTLHEVPIVRAL